MKLESATEKIFTCDACKYTFSAAKYEKRCPDCGKLQVRSASPKEIDDYIQIQMEIVQAGRKSYPLEESACVSLCNE